MGRAGQRAAVPRDYQLNGNQDSLAMAGKFAHFIPKPAMWEPAGPENGHFAGHFHGNLWTLQAVLEYALVTNDVAMQRIVVLAYDYARSRGVVEMGRFPSLVDPETFKRPAILAQLNETCGVADALVLALKLSQTRVGDYWDDVHSVRHPTASPERHVDSLVPARAYTG